MLKKLRIYLMRIDNKRMERTASRCSERLDLMLNAHLR